MPVFKVHLLPSLPSSPTPEQSPAVSREDPFTQGKKRKRLCYQRRRVNALYFNIGRNLILFEDCFCFVLFCFCVLVLNVARNTNSCLCVRTCIQKGIITTLLDLFFFFHDNLSFLKDFLTNLGGLSYRDFLCKKNNFYGILKKCWKYYDEFILLKMCTYLLLFLYLLIMSLFYLIWAKEGGVFMPACLVLCLIILMRLAWFLKIFPNLFISKFSNENYLLLKRSNMSDCCVCRHFAKTACGQF